MKYGYRGAAALFFIAASAAAGELLGDGGFEGTPSRWQCAPASQVRRVDREAFAGKYAMQLAVEPGQGVAQLFSPDQVLETGTDQSCRVRFSFRHRGHKGGVFFHLLSRKEQKFSPVTDETGKPVFSSFRVPEAKEWSEFSREIELPAAYLRGEPGFRLQFQCWRDDLLLDEVSVIILGPAPPESPEKKKSAEVTVLPPPDGDGGAPPMPEPPYRYGSRDGYLTRDGRPFFYAGSGTVGGGQWNMQTLWMLRLLNYSMCSVDICTNHNVNKDAAGRYSIDWNEPEPAISVIREMTRMGILIEADGGNYRPDSRSLFREMKQTAPGYGSIFTTSSHFYSFDHNTELGRSFHYNDWLSRFRYLKDFPFMAFECWNELGYRPEHERVLAGFREFAKKKYGTLAEANRVWRRDFKSWEEVLPPHLSRNIMTGAQAHQYRLAMREKFFQMYYDWLRFVQEDFISGFRIMKKKFRTFSNAPWSVDWRGHRHYSDGYCALDPDLLEEVIDINLLHTWISPYEHNGEPADAPSVLDSISTALLYHNFLRTNSRKPIMNPEDILERVMIPGSNLEAMKRNCLGRFPQEWKFRLDSDDRGIAQGYFKPEYDDSQWGRMAVPGCWDETERYKGKRGYGWYRAEFEVPMAFRQDWLDGSRKFYLYGKGIAQKGTVWVNGMFAGKVESWAAPYQYDIGALLKFGEKNQITILADGSGYSNGIRFYVHILPHDRINETRPCGEKEYATRLWSYMMQGSSGVVLWSWEDCWRPFLPRLINEVNSVAPVAMPEVRRETGRRVGFLMPYLFFRGLPEASEKYYLDYMTFFGAAVFRQLPVSVFSEKNILAATPESVPLLFYPYARIVHRETFEHMKRHVENGGTAVVTLDSLRMDFERYSDLGLEAFTGISVVGDYTGSPEILYGGRRLPLRQGDMCGKTGVSIRAPGAEVLARYADGSPAAVRVKRGKGRVVFIAANPDLAFVHELLGELAPELGIVPEIELASTGTGAEFPYLEGRLAGKPERFLLYLHNWGGFDREAAVRLPQRLLTARNYRIRNVRDVSAPAKTVAAAELTKQPYPVNIPAGTPVALLFEDASQPALPFKGVAPERAGIIEAITAGDRNPPDLDSPAPKALFLAPVTTRERIGRIVYPQLAESLRRTGVEVWELPLEKLTPGFLKKFDLLFLGEGHAESIHPLGDRKHPFYDAVLEYVRDGGALMVAGGSAIGYQFNARQQLNAAFGSRLGFSCSAWSSADNYPRNPDSCGYNDPRQVLAVDFTDHPAAEFLKSVQFFTMPVFRIRPDSPMKAIVKTSERDLTAPGLPLVIGGDYEKGRMIFTSDLLWFQPFRIETADNFQLLMNCLNYLLGREIVRYSPGELKKLLLFSEEAVRKAEAVENSH